MNIVIPAAGAGSRFKNIYQDPKPYIAVDNLPMIVLAAKTLGVAGTYHYILPEHGHNHNIHQQLSSITPACTFNTIDYVTEGAVQTALLLEDSINNDEELIITNCDQVMHWNVEEILQSLRKFDAAVVTINSTDPKHSYAHISDDNRVTKVAEKQVISDFALTGIHYWKKGKYFVNSAKQLIADNNRSLNEFYVSTTYNYLIDDGLQVGYTNINENHISFIGTPEDLDKYNASK